MEKEIINEPTQLDRIESKVDKILHILESGDLSTLQLDGEKIAENIKKMSAYDRYKNRF